MMKLNRNCVEFRPVTVIWIVWWVLSWFRPRVDVQKHNLFVNVSFGWAGLFAALYTAEATVMPFLDCPIIIEKKKNNRPLKGSHLHIENWAVDRRNEILTTLFWWTLPSYLIPCRTAQCVKVVQNCAELVLCICMSVTVSLRSKKDGTLHQWHSNKF